ncbi:ferritin-like protein [Streptomyces sp. CBMA156]|uniref:ferritin-like protein n=1 Tax=Streptomyces sp. CBMA156 TaxID=1930280 RepID=UPI001661DE2B|nr:ferritin-like protein [Streptomyces sp. CBMA156]MBD0673538.1 hypothetical protein [Streptomyces sp. CBMA156]
MTFEDDIKKLHEMLQGACLVEFSTIPAYLTGWWSIKDRRSTAAKLLRELVTVEMRHLSIAANVLIATGGEPDIHAVAALDYPRSFVAPGPLTIHLLPFGKPFLNMGMTIESPGDATPCVPKEDAEVMLAQSPEYDPQPPTLITFGAKETIGEFYRSLMKHLDACVAQYGENKVFPKGGRVERQYAYFGQDRITVQSRDEADALMQDIIWEGEGDGGGILDSNRDLSHFFTFHELSVGRFYKPDDKPCQPTGDTFPVPEGDGVVDTLPDPKVAAYAKYPAAVKAAGEFTDLYGQMITDLDAGFKGNPDLVDRAVGRMRQLLARADAVLDCELTDRQKYAAPTFELPAKK